jgi:hypothetical protein
MPTKLRKTIKDHMPSSPKADDSRDAAIITPTTLAICSVEWTIPSVNRPTPLASWAKRTIPAKEVIMSRIRRKDVGLSHTARRKSPKPSEMWRSPRCSPIMNANSTWTTPNTAARGRL